MTTTSAPEVRASSLYRNCYTISLQVSEPPDDLSDVPEATRRHRRLSEGHLICGALAAETAKGGYDRRTLFSPTYSFDERLVVEVTEIGRTPFDRTAVAEKAATLWSALEAAR
jgi:hypothetical protein